MSGSDAPADRIELRGISAWAHHGVLAHETELGQEFTLDLVLHVDLSVAAASDELDDTVDYGTVASAAHAALVGPSARLVEHVAGRVADAVLAVDPRIAAVDVALHKPAAPLVVPATDVVVRVHRPRPT